MLQLKSNLILITAMILVISSCQQTPDLGKALSRKFNNPSLKHLSLEEVAPFLEKKLLKARNTETGTLLAAGYHNRSYTPVFLQRYLPGNGMELLLEHINAAGEHGLDPVIFRPNRLLELMDTLQNRKALATPEATAEMVAELELQLAGTLARYSNALLFGITNPSKIYPRYYTDTGRPDSASMDRLFNAREPESWLDSIQPVRPEYLFLQKELARLQEPAENAAVDTTSGGTLRQTLVVNLERLRWKTQPDSLREAGKYVEVNIAAYCLYVMEKGKPVLDMKVCVGEPSRRWQTPQLNSLIERVQVNPVWNIPESIASREIMSLAAADPYYLENANIDVYRNGEKIEDSRKINWDEVSGKNSAYRFKQRPGSKNALGKIKFLFDNQSSVYLHDTPAKAAFDKEKRAVSHGCVRLEKPLELARALFGEGPGFEKIKSEMSKKDPEARNIKLPQEIPVYLTYYTFHINQNGRPQVFPDVYGLDKLVLEELKAAAIFPAKRL